MCQVPGGIGDTAVTKPDRVPGEDIVALHPDAPLLRTGAPVPPTKTSKLSPLSDATG